MTDILDQVPPAMFSEPGTDLMAPDEDAPFGYTIDRATGQRRPKMLPGRPRVAREEPAADDVPAPAGLPPSIDELKEQSGDVPRETEPDRRPGTRVVRHRGVAREKAKAPRSVPASRPGQITTGVNRLYRRAGKIVRAMDADIGTAIIESAKNTADDGEPDDSVGAAWEELARTNPRIRAFLLRMIAGGAWGQLVMAHAPIAMAIMMKPAILRLIPFSGLIESMSEPDEDAPEGDLPGGMQPADAQEMARLAQDQMRKMGMSVPPEVAAQMASMAGAMFPGNSATSVPFKGGPQTARHQPRRPGSRSERAGK